jgi:hypothetical protein
MTKNAGLPTIVSQTEWETALKQLRVKEKAATRANSALAAERRRLPMVSIDKSYLFAGPDGKISLLDLFEGRRQLLLYHFMFAPGVSGWPAKGCGGCSMFVRSNLPSGPPSRAGCLFLSRVTSALSEYRELQKDYGVRYSMGLLGGERLQQRFRHHNR